MRDKLLADLIEITDQMATILSDEGQVETSVAEREKILKTWNTMRQAIGAPADTGDRPLGQPFNSEQRVRRASASKVTIPNRALH